MTALEQNYSWLDRMLHRLAFSRPVQMTAVDVERSMFGRRFTGIPVERPVFVTSLPRAGTTLLLEILGRLPAFATYSYRDMPFVLSPLLWSSMSGQFRKPAALKERAHGDGMAVGYDSPEAFEEVLWRASWPEKFGADGIDLWAEDEDAGEFAGLLTSQMQRIIAARTGAGDGASTRRYLSKNNANVARLGLIRRLVPDATILVPVRRPLDQAASLLRQHLRFLEIHHQDDFARRYMDDVGHLEFGALHRPIRFAGMVEVRRRFVPASIDYWLAYWTRAFTHVLAHERLLTVVAYERLCEAGLDGVRTLTARLGVHDAGPSAPAHAELRPPRPADATAADPALLREADALYARLSRLSVV